MSAHRFTYDTRLPNPPVAKLIAAVRSVLAATSRNAGTAHAARGVWMRAFPEGRERPYDHYALFERMERAANAAERTLPSRPASKRAGRRKRPRTRRVDSHLTLPEKSI